MRTRIQTASKTLPQQFHIALTDIAVHTHEYSVLFTPTRNCRAGYFCVYTMLINGQGGNSKASHKLIITSVQSNKVVNFMYPFHTISSGNTNSVHILKY